jgi:hypothetical protein
MALMSIASTSRLVLSSSKSRNVRLLMPFADISKRTFSEMPPLKKGEALKRFARDLTADAKAGKLDPGLVQLRFVGSIPGGGMTSGEVLRNFSVTFLPMSWT